MLEQGKHNIIFGHVNIVHYMIHLTHDYYNEVETIPEMGLLSVSVLIVDSLIK